MPTCHPVDESRPGTETEGRLPRGQAIVIIRRPRGALLGGSDRDRDGAARAAIADRYFLSPRVKRLKSILAKLDPEAERPTAIPYPPPLPSAVPSFLYAKLKDGRRRR